MFGGGVGIKGDSHFEEIKWESYFVDKITVVNIKLSIVIPCMTGLF